MENLQECPGMEYIEHKVCVPREPITDQLVVLKAYILVRTFGALKSGYSGHYC